jgi:hypothetical protein
MSVRDRLQRLTGDKPAKKGEDFAGGERAEQIRALRARIDAVLARRPDGQRPSLPAAGRGAAPLEAFVAGGEVFNEAGCCFCAHHEAKGSFRHGRRSIRDLTPLDMDRLALLANDPALKVCSDREALFLDTETTGLAGGTGTVAFLIGLGWFEGDSFVTRQLFARDYAEETAALHCLTHLIQGRRFLVSFNGKAFDVNLLAARFVMNRLPDPLSGMPHLDLLHPARRLLSHRLADRRLGSLEGELLGFQREGDLPGSEIPQRYFDWLRRRDGRPMTAVFEHNRLDILSLAALTAHLAELIDPEGEGASRHPGDRLAAARLWLARNCQHEAVRLLAPLAGDGRRDAAREACRELSLLYRRSDRVDEAVALWEKMVARDEADVFALVELAKWHEHRRRDPGRALALTRQASGCGGRLSPEDRAALARRQARLEKKCAAPEEEPRG